MSHVVDDLELYALRALPEERAEAIAAHLRTCTSCRTAADELLEVVASLADAAPVREPPAGLKERILAAASAEARPARPSRPWRLPMPGIDRRALALAAAIVLLLGGVVGQSVRLSAMQQEAERYEAMVERFAHGGRTWYMAGVAEWQGMGGDLVQPPGGEPAFVLFHGLRPLPAGQMYALWLVSADGAWARGTSFTSDGNEYQMVAVGQDLGGYQQCAVTVETSPTGKRAGPIVMQSRIAPPTP